jgi:peptidoglycan/xylan/chitin deacetylase (PgdA/CDA1 family)
MFEELNLPITLLVNSAVYEETPEVVEPFRLRGDEISCHGRTNSERQSGLSEDQERLLIEEATKTITGHEGAAPKGWLGPWISETYATPDLLKEAGYQYLLDWCCDDQPVWLRTKSGPLLSVPYPQELNDSSSVIGRYVSGPDFAEMIIDQFEEMMMQSVDEPLVLGIALHAHISGQPFRLRALRKALAHISDRSRGQWLTRAGSIADHFARVVPAIS